MKLTHSITVATLLVSTLMLGTLPGVGHAVEDDVAAIAREQYTRGKELYEQKKYAESLESFQAAYQTKPHPTVLKSVAECQIQLGDLPAAVETLERYLATRGTKGHKAIRKRIRKLKSQIATVEVFSTPSGGGLIVNGIATTDITPATIKLAAGDHKISIDVEGYEPIERDLTVVGGRLSTLKVDFTKEGTPLPEPEPEPVLPEDDLTTLAESQLVAQQDRSLSTPAAFWICAGLAAAGTINGAIFGSLSLKKEGDFKADQSQTIKDQGELYALVADISFGVAIASAVAGTIILIARNTGEEELNDPLAADETKLQVTPIAGADTIGLGASLTF